MQRLPTPLILKPALALVVWTQLVLVGLYATRIPAIENLKAEGKMDISKMSDSTKEEFNANIPPYARWVADNYNHLVEHPTIFYALIFYIDRAGHSTQTLINLAWSYVGLRVAHTCVQCMGNKIMVRFSVFISSAAVCAAMTGLVAKRELAGVKW
jgi:hypothetical protein